MIPTPKRIAPMLAGAATGIAVERTGPRRSRGHYPRPLTVVMAAVAAVAALYAEAFVEKKLNLSQD